MNIAQQKYSGLCSPSCTRNQRKTKLQGTTTQDPSSPLSLKYKMSFASTKAQHKQGSQVGSEPTVSSFEIDECCNNFWEQGYCTEGTNCCLSHRQETKMPRSTALKVLSNYPELVMSLTKRTHSLFY